MAWLTPPVCGRTGVEEQYSIFQTAVRLVAVAEDHTVHVVTVECRQCTCRRFTASAGVTVDQSDAEP
jgi:hypothetical protein